MVAADGWGDILCYIASHRHRGIAAVAIDDAHLISRDAGVIHLHLTDIRERKGFAHDGHGFTVCIGHLTRLRGRKLISDAAHLDV